ncbi:MAG: ribonuclease P protein component [bacterium]
MHSPVKQGFPKKHRLGQKKLIDTIFSKGKFARAGLLKLKYIKQSEGHARFVISISKRVGNSPARNRVKRLIREALRSSDKISKCSIDCAIFITNPPRQELTLSYIKYKLNQFLDSLPLDENSTGNQ